MIDIFIQHIMIYTIFNIYIYHTLASVEVSEVMKCKNGAWLFGTAGEGGFTLDQFLRLFFDVFLTNLNYKPDENR
jgi:hypothetical protein